MSVNVLRGGSVKMSGVTLETSTSITLTANLGDSSTKDDAEGWDKQEITSRSWSVQSDRLVENSGATAEALLKKWIDQTSAEAITVSIGSGGSITGNAIISQLDIDATVKQDVSVSASYTGVGAVS